MNLAVSINKVPIRLTNERWQHISVGHPEMSDYYYEILETIENPIIIYRGNSGEFIAISRKDEISNKFFVVIYKEIENKDGYVITAFLSKKQQFFEKKEILWKP